MFLSTFQVQATSSDSYSDELKSTLKEESLCFCCEAVNKSCSVLLSKRSVSFSKIYPSFPEIYPRFKWINPSFSKIPLSFPKIYPQFLKLYHSVQGYPLRFRRFISISQDLSLFSNDLSVQFHDKAKKWSH